MLKSVLTVPLKAALRFSPGLTVGGSGACGHGEFENSVMLSHGLEHETESAAPV